MAINLDMDGLRTFVTIVDAGSFAIAAERVGRTASAISLQITRLEKQVETKLFQKAGRRMVPTIEGEQFLQSAREILALNDRLVESLHHQKLSGVVRLGAIQDFADTVLPAVLSQFKLSHPAVRIQARVDQSQNLIKEVQAGKLDLAIGVSGLSGGKQKIVRRDAIMWLGQPGYELDENEPVPLILFESPCSFRDAAISVLNEVGREWKIVFTSPSLSGLRAAAQAGLGITARTQNAYRGALEPLSSSSKLPLLPSVEFALYEQAEISDAGRRLADIFIQELENL